MVRETKRLVPLDGKERRPCLEQDAPPRRQLGPFEIDRPADKDATALSQQAGLVIGWHLRELTHTEARLRRDVRRFRNAKPFWRPAQPATAPVIVIDAASPSLSTQANGRRGVFVRGERGQRQRMDAGGEFGGEGLIDEPLARDAALASKGG